MKNRLKELNEQANNLLTQMRGVIETASKENRATTAEENEKYDAMDADFTQIKSEISRLESFMRNESFMSEVPNIHAVSHSERSVKGDDEYNANFWRYVRGADFVRDALSTTDANGGYTVPKTFQTTIIEQLNKECLMRRLCSVMTTTSTNLIPVEATKATFKWLGEATAYGESGMTFSQIQIGAYKAGGIVKISEELLNDSAVNLESYVRRKMIDGIVELEESAFISGDGAQKPSGILKDITAGITTNAANKFTADELVDMLYSLKVGYRNKGVWLVSDAFEREVRKLKDGNGQYIWQQGLTSDAPNTLLGRPIYVSEFMDNELTTGKQPAIFGDLKYYQIADRGGIGLQRLNELYAGNGQVGFRIHKRTDAVLTLSEAVKSFKMK